MPPKHVYQALGGKVMGVDPRYWHWVAVHVAPVAWKKLGPVKLAPHQMCGLQANKAQALRRRADDAGDGWLAGPSPRG